MKRYLFFMFLLAPVLLVNAQNWSVDKAHSNVGFTVTHMMLSEVDGAFNEIEASIVSEKDDLSDAVFSFSAQTNSVDSRVERRDNDLRSERFFDVENYPTINFTSTSFKRLEGTSYELIGDLTIKDVTLEVRFDATVNGPIVHPRNNKKMIGIKATATIDRYLFHVGGESGSGQSREVKIFANGEFSKE